jgi:hypothetical protein
LSKDKPSSLELLKSKVKVNFRWRTDHRPKRCPKQKIKATRVIKLSEFASKPQAKERKGDQGKETATSACGTHRETEREG